MIDFQKEIPTNVVNALRTILIFLRESAGKTRSQIAKSADLNPTDLDNFTTTKLNSAEERVFKTIKPSMVFFIRSADYVLIHEGNNIRNYSNKNLIKKLDIVDKYMSTFSRASGDPLFEYFKNMKITDLKSAKQLSRTLNGEYFMYRYSDNRNKIFRSHLKVSKYDVYRKVTNFTNTFKDKDGSLKITNGYVLDLDGKYHFIGFVGDFEEDTTPYGIKTVIVGHPKRNKPQDKYKGIFLSYNGKSEYEFGKVILDRLSGAKRPEDHIGEFNLNEVNLASFLDIEMRSNPNVKDTIYGQVTIDRSIIVDDFQ